MNLFTEIEGKELIQATEKEPQARLAQKALAAELTCLVNGLEELKKAEEQTIALFNSNDASSAETALTLTEKQLAAGYTIQDLVVDCGTAPSKGAARRLIEGGGIYLNDERVSDFSAPLTKEQFVDESFLVLRSGKKKRFKVELNS